MFKFVKKLAVVSEVFNLIIGSWKSRAIQVAADVVTSKVFTTRMEMAEVMGYRDAVEYIRKSIDAANLFFATHFVATAILSMNIPVMIALLPYASTIALSTGFVMGLMCLLA